MKKKIVALLIGAVLGIAAFEGFGAHAAQEQTAEKEYTITAQDGNHLWMATGTITAAEHTDDFSGWFVIRSDYGREYLAEFDPEDFCEGDRVIFAAYRFGNYDDTDFMDPAFCDIIRAHCINY